MIVSSRAGCEHESGKLLILVAKGVWERTGMGERKAVFFAADAAYLPLAWVAARDVAAQPGRDFDVCLLLPEDVAAPPPPGVRVLRVRLPEVLAHVAGPAHMSPFAYARLAAPALWLSDYDKLLYLDSDIRVSGDLSPLFALEMGEALAAMVEDCGRYLGAAGGREDWDEYRTRTGLRLDAPYFNSGVILMNAARWRAEALWAQAASFIAARGAQLRFMDQDALNVLGGRILELSPRWNFCTHYMGLGLEGVVVPRVRHYLNVLKPWRDPEWAILYGKADVKVFGAAFARSPWPGFVHQGLVSALPWRKRAALAAAKAARHVPEAALAGHMENFIGLAPRLWRDVRAGFAEGAKSYVDLSSEEAAAWKAALT
ncbi:glycosyltransferase family 8 protein [Acidocella facilis]|uniref:glycosyltransferase family 8 protein n=1 Tax=Acidocella facilis TaxID=525 RepID=UPI0012DE0800|nr:glycosyltransferase family 8 protein [Acidocella facilis]